ncbi:MAG: lipid-A-disaccharide synthase [Syntrophobacteraceae bacterium]
MHIFLSAGEASGDLHASNLARAIMTASPGVRLSCLGGPLLESAGVPVIVNNRDISVVGAFEVLHHAKAIYRAWRKLRSHLITDPPDAVVLIDFPDFNFFLGKFAKKNGTRIIYYISPQLWAWREYRVKTIRRLVDRMVVILPFEEAFYDSHGMKVDYVGHPLIDALRAVPGLESSMRKYRSGTHEPLIGILPGSRRSEMNLLFDTLMETARQILRESPGAGFIIPVAPSLDPDMIRKRASARDLPIQVVEADTYGVIRACDLIITVSGTVTLESAILGTPMIIVNRVSRLSGEIGKRLIRVKWVGLPNLIAGREVVPEFIQDNARPEAICAEAVSLLNNPARLEQQRSEFSRIRGLLGKPGVADRVAKLVLKTAGDLR